jgi:hypothetical protein
MRPALSPFKIWQTLTSLPTVTEAYDSGAYTTIRVTLITTTPSTATKTTRNSW